MSLSSRKPTASAALLRSRLLLSGVGAALLFFLVAPGTLADQAADTDLELLWDHAQEAIGNGNYREAEKFLRQYVVLQPENEAAVRDLARVLSWQARYDESLNYFAIYLEQFSYDVDVAVERAQVIAWQGKYRIAELEVRKILAREPENIDANLLLAGVLEWQGRKREAKEIYNWILKLDPKNSAAHRGRQEVRRSLSPVLEMLLSYVQDDAGYLFLGASEGVWVFITASLSLKPFLSQSYASDDLAGTFYGLGGGLAGKLAVTDSVTLGAEGNALYYAGDSDPFIDWGGKLTGAFSPLDSLFLEVGFDTRRYGSLAQSTAALEAGVRTWRGSASASYRRGDFSAFGYLDTGLLTLDGEQIGMTTSGLLPPGEAVRRRPALLSRYAPLVYRSLRAGARWAVLVAGETFIAPTGGPARRRCFP